MDAIVTTRYAPLVLSQPMNALPAGDYLKYMTKFKSEGGVTIEEQDEIRICVNLRKLNDACANDPFSTAFMDEVLDKVGRQEEYSFTDGFSGYHQIKITPEDRSKMTFLTECGCF